MTNRGASGFSMVEVVVAIAILGVALFGLTQGLATALGSSKESELQTTAALFAAGQIEGIRATGGLVDGETEGDCGGNLPLYRWRQTLAGAGIDGLHEVTVVVENAQNGQEIYELKTLLFERPEDSTATATGNQQNTGRKGGARQ